MAWYRGAVQKNIRPGANDPPITVIGVILHVDAGNNSSLYEYFRDRSGGIESHFHIPARNPIEQYRNTGFEADANWKANSFWRDGTRYGFISVETQGLEFGTWNQKQMRDIKDLLLWASRTHDFPLRKCSGPYSPGVGYHTMWGSPSAWTPVAKSCPGPNRIQQFNHNIVRWMEEGDDEEMEQSPENREFIFKSSVGNDSIPVPDYHPEPDRNPTWALQTYVRHLAEELREVKEMVDRLLNE